MDYIEREPLHPSTQAERDQALEAATHRARHEIRKRLRHYAYATHRDPDQVFKEFAKMYLPLDVHSAVDFVSNISDEEVRREAHSEILGQLARAGQPDAAQCYVMMIPDDDDREAAAIELAP